MRKDLPNEDSNRASLFLRLHNSFNVIHTIYKQSLCSLEAPIMQTGLACHTPLEKSLTAQRLMTQTRSWTAQPWARWHRWGTEQPLCSPDTLHLVCTTHLAGPHWHVLSHPEGAKLLSTNKAQTVWTSCSCCRHHQGAAREQGWKPLLCQKQDEPRDPHQDIFQLNIKS